MLIIKQTDRGSSVINPRQKNLRVGGSSAIIFSKAWQIVRAGKDEFEVANGTGRNFTTVMQRVNSKLQRNKEMKLQEHMGINQGLCQNK